MQLYKEENIRDYGVKRWWRKVAVSIDDEVISLVLAACPTKYQSRHWIFDTEESLFQGTKRNQNMTVCIKAPWSRFVIYKIQGVVIVVVCVLGWQWSLGRLKTTFWATPMVKTSCSRKVSTDPNTTRKNRIKLVVQFCIVFILYKDGLGYFLWRGGKRRNIFLGCNFNKHSIGSLYKGVRRTLLTVRKGRSQSTRWRRLRGKAADG